MTFILRIAARRLLAFVLRAALQRKGSRLHPTVRTLGLLAVELL